MRTLESKINQINRLPVPIRRAMFNGLKQRQGVVFNEETNKIEASVSEVIIEVQTPKKKRKAKKKAE